MTAQRSTSIAAVFLFLLATSAFAAGPRSYSAGRFALVLDGNHAGFVSGVAGGFASGNVVEEPESPEYFVKKHLEDPPQFGDITIECGNGMSAAFYAWLKDSLGGNLSQRKNGAIVALDFQSNMIRQLNFSNAQITRITFPRLDAGSKEAGKLTVTLTPSATYLVKTGGTYGTPPASKGGQQWLASNFRLTIPGLDASKVSTIEAIDISIPLTAPPQQECNSCTPVPAKINFPNLELVTGEASSADWFRWHETFVLEGQHDDGQEKRGTLDLLTPTMKGTIFSVAFTGLGIVSVANEPASAGSESIPKVRATMYAEQITLVATP